jgi:choice-of-anchor C domain-containing protein
MKKKLCVCMIIALYAGQSFANLIQNGSFESGANPGSTFSTLAAGSTAIDYWTITSGSIDYISGYWQAADGSRSLDMSGNGAGSISQDFTIVKDQMYKVTFYMSGNPDGGDITKTLSVSATGVKGIGSQSFDYVTGSNSLTDMMWQEKTWYFTAAISGLTTLTFSSQEFNAWGPALDDVTVSLVPVPATILLGFLGLGIGGWKLRKSL